jgi:hypothetical protein
MDIYIHPYEGVNQYRFGMTRKEVEKLTGKPSQTEVNKIMQEVYEHRNGITLVFEENKLEAILIHKGLSAFLNEKNLMAIDNESVVSLLKSLDEQAQETKSHLLSLKFGICLGGFGKKRIPEGKLIIVFSENRKEFYEDYIIV